MVYFVIESLRSYNYSNTPDLQKNFLFYRNLSTHLNIFDDIFNVLFLYSWSSWQKNSKLPQNNLYTWKSSNRHLYWSSLCKKIRRTIPFKSQPKSRTLQTAKKSFSKVFWIAWRIFKTVILDNTTLLSSEQIQKFLNILSLQISSEDYETWITVGRQFFGPSDKVSVICIIETRNTSISTRLYIVELRYTVEI